MILRDMTSLMPREKGENLAMSIPDIRTTPAGIDASELRRYIVYPVLQSMHLYSLAAERLVLGTAAQESGMGKYLRQMRGGPARGIYQMEVATLNDLYDNFLRYNHDLFQLVDRWRILNVTRDIDAIGNLYYATALCRAQYYRFQEPLPGENDIEGMARYYKTYWNGPGAATPEQFVDNYRRYVGIA